MFFAVGIWPPLAALGVVPSYSSGERASIIVTFPMLALSSSKPMMIDGSIGVVRLEGL